MLWFIGLNPQHIALGLHCTKNTCATSTRGRFLPISPWNDSAYGQSTLHPFFTIATLSIITQSVFDKGVTEKLAVWPLDSTTRAQEFFFWGPFRERARRPTGRLRRGSAASRHSGAGMSRRQNTVCAANRPATPHSVSSRFPPRTPNPVPCSVVSHQLQVCCGSRRPWITKPAGS